MRIAEKGCPKCDGDVYAQGEKLEDNTYDVYCIQCGYRNFPDELGLLAATIQKLKRKYSNWDG
jgi:predicted nucleic-acid-binding Zn-ribbon protein